MTKALKIAAALLLLSGGGFLIYRGAHQYFGAIGAQREAARQWSQTHPPQTNTTEPEALSAQKKLPAFIPEGTPFSKLVVPRLDQTLYVVEGDDSMALSKGPGHVRGSAMPGDKGNCVIAAHRDLHFRFLKDIEQGDEIVLQDVAGVFRYKVTGTKIINPTQIEVLQPTATAQLHLITCYPFYFAGHAPKRFVVTAELVGAKPEVPPELFARKSAPKTPVYVAPHREMRREVIARKPVPKRNDVDYERSIEATRALNRAAAAAL